MHYRLPAHSPYQSDNVLAPELYHDQLHQDLGTLSTQPSAPSLSSPRGSQQTFSVSPAADERSGHLLFEDAGPYLRETLRIPPYQDINLWALPDPPEGEKPNQPYPILIKLAIYGSPHKQLTLQEIYTTLEDRFQWFRERRNERAWKNSIRHNLSLNKVFKHAPRAITEPGKGSYWQLD
ncbi:winged helix DNA-binding domain-containing protein, partial [Rhizopogon salebrosus TDB-379]